LLDRPAGAGEGNEVLNQVLEDLEPGAAEALMALLMTGGALLPSTDAPAMPSLDADVRDALAAVEAALAGMPTEVEASPTSAMPAAAPDVEVIPQAAAALAASSAVDREVEAEEPVNSATSLLERASGAEQAQVAEPAEALPRGDVEAQPETPEVGSARSTEGEQTIEFLDRPVDAAPQRATQPSVTSAAEANAASTAGVQPGTPSAEPVASARPERVVSANTLPEAVADVVQGAVLRGDSEVRLVLNPPELGHLDIRIVTSEGGLRVQMEAAQSGARDLIEQALPSLQQGLEARDLRVDRLEVRATDTGRGSFDSNGAGQGGSGGQTDGRDGQPEWSGVAAFQQGQGDAASVTPSKQAAVQDGRLDVLA
jgi:flagellar hook-length control protein FliK